MADCTVVTLVPEAGDEIQTLKSGIMEIADVDYDKAGEVLEIAQGHVKTALMMILTDIDAQTAREKLQDADGFIKTALQG